MTEPPRTLQERLRRLAVLFGPERGEEWHVAELCDAVTEAADALAAQTKLLAARDAEIAGMRGSLVGHITYFQTTEPLLAEAREALAGVMVILDTLPAPAGLSGALKKACIRRSEAARAVLAKFKG